MTSKAQSKRKKLNIKGILKGALVSLCVFVFWVGVWQVVYMLVNKPIVIPSPLETAKRMGELLLTWEFYLITASSVLRILLGYMLGVVLGVVLAVLTSASKILYALFKPIISIARATPVASLTLIIIMWVTNSQVPLVIVGLMVFPIIWGNTFEGIRETDKKLLEMSKVFSVGGLSRLIHIYLPSVYPYFISGASASLGLAWKSGIAAEILGTTQNSVGQQLNDAKVYLDSEGKFAWTLVVIILSIIFEKLVVFALKKTTLRLSPKRKKNSHSDSVQPGTVTVKAENVQKVFGDKQVLRNVNLELRAGSVTAVKGVSGAGKTTLLRILAGLDRSFDGKVSRQGKVNFLFQENRLLPWLTAEENILFVNPDADTEKYLSLVYLQDAGKMYPNELSGGMKRRLAIARALAGKGGTLFLDEPFAGLDEELMKNVAENIFLESRHKAVAIVTHQGEELLPPAFESIEV